MDETLLNQRHLHGVKIVNRRRKRDRDFKWKKEKEEFPRKELTDRCLRAREEACKGERRGEVRLRDGAGLSGHVLPGAENGADDARVGLHTSGG